VKLDSFLAVKSVGSADVANATPAASGERSTGAALADAGGELDHQAPAQAPAITRDVTPSGIEVLYQSSPKRLYKVRQLKTDQEFSDEGVEWREVPSVTTVLDVLRKDGLAWWGQGRAVQGVIDLFDLGALTSGLDWSSDRQFLAIPQGEDELRADEASVVDLLKQHKLTVNHRLDQASDRGVNVHDALESWARTGRLPNAREFPPEEKGYVEGLLKFIEDVDPTPIRCEVMVGSVEHKFAGRFDLDMSTTEPREYTSRCYPKRKDKREILEPGLRRVDAKTSRGVYTSHHLQLAGYEIAAVEGGYEESDERVVLRLDAAGKYELVKTSATAEQFLAVRSVYAALEGLK
jgi:hypothetical protein